MAGAGFIDYTFDGNLSEVTIDQERVVTQFKVNSWFRPTGSYLAGEWKRLREVHESHPHEAKTQGARSAVGAAGSNDPVAPIGHYVPTPTVSPSTLFIVTSIPPDMSAGTGSGTGTGGTQKKACYVFATTPNSSIAGAGTGTGSGTGTGTGVGSDTGTLVRVVYPHAVGDAFYATTPAGGAGWPDAGIWTIATPPGVGAGSGTGTGTGTSGAQHISWLESMVCPVPLNIAMAQDGGESSAPTYTIKVGTTTIASAWNFDQVREWGPTAGMVITPANQGIAGFDSNGNFFVSYLNEQYNTIEICSSGGT